MEQIFNEFYNFKEINTAASDVNEFAKHVLGMVPIRGSNGYNHPTRPNSDSGAMIIYNDGWHDFISHTSGSALDLYAMVRCSGDKLQASQELGKFFNLTPTTIKVKKSKGFSIQAKLDAGFKIEKEYKYCDASGEHIHSVFRLTKAGEKKAFIQTDAKLQLLSKSNVELVPYNLSGVINTQTVFITEGEKDADTLISMGLCATTNASGALNFEKNLAGYFVNKHVVIVEDNDKAGIDRTAKIGSILCDVALSIKVVKFDMLKEKSDATDYYEQFGEDKLKKYLMLERPCLKNKFKEQNVEANELNSENAIFNFVEVTQGTKILKRPKPLKVICKEILKAFNNFPKRVGETLFFYNEEDDEVKYISNANELKAFLSLERFMALDNGRAFSNYIDIYNGLKSRAQAYKNISFMPTVPTHKHIFYAHKPIDMSTHDGTTKRLDTLCGYFNNAADKRSEAYIKAFIMSACWYETGENRPIFVIDSINGQGSGKTTLVNMAAMLYRSSMGDGIPLSIVQDNLHGRTDEINKNILSSFGREKKYLLVDNVVKDLDSPYLAEMTTASYISGRRSYGVGEESRPNDLTIAITVNGASMREDFASRSLFVLLKRPNYNLSFGKIIKKYIKEFRFEIIKDIMFLINQKEPADFKPMTRFPEFERNILCKVSDGTEEYEEYIEDNRNNVEESNIDIDNAEAIKRLILGNIENMKYNEEDHNSVFIDLNILKIWAKDFPDSSITQQNIAVLITQMVKTGKIDFVNYYIKRLYIGNVQYRGFLFTTKEKEIKKSMDCSIISLNVMTRRPLFTPYYAVTDRK